LNRYRQKRSSALALKEKEDSAGMETGGVQ
jgi:hypothetical protein